MKSKSILISGASIAGPALAFWLKKYGFEPTIVEYAPALRKGGNGIDVRGLAIEVVKRMGVWEKVKAARIDMDGISFVDVMDKSKARIDLKYLKRDIGSEEVELTRGDLAAILYDATKKDTEYIFGDTITSLQQKNNGVLVTFKKSAPRRFDLVIGADGIHSTVRRLAFGPEASFVRFKDHYFAFANTDSSLGDKGWMSLYNVPGKVAGVYLANNQAQAKAYFMFRAAQQIKYDYTDIEQQKHILTDAYTNMGWHIPQLLVAATKDPDFYFDSLSQVIMPHWSVGRVALVGDAAYCASPVTGAGATLSLVGAYRLAGELALAKGDYKKGFSEYEHGYRGVIKQAQSELFTNILVPKTALGIWMRNTLTRLPVMGTLASLEQRLKPKASDHLPDYT